MKRIIAILLAAVLIFALFGCSKQEEATTTAAPETTTETTTEAPPPTNPLTGKDGYNAGAVGKRPVAIVVENLRPARPQWGITTPDIIVEGEVEGGISRMLWLYADYTSVPEKVGPIRSARPSYVKFAKLFDAVYIHWGGSHSKAGYVGGYETIKKEKVNDIDGMAGGELFDRDHTRNVSSEHRGILNGKKIPNAIKKKGYRTAADESIMSTLSFNEASQPAGTDKADRINLTFSNRTDTRRFKYSADDKSYHTNDWETDVKFKNVIILQDESEYITTPYKGGSTTYLNYKYKGGNGYYASKGTKTAIKWAVKDGKLVLSDLNGQELKLNVGRSYIGFSSTNHEGKVTFETAE